MTPELDTLDHLVLTVADIPATITFYTQSLGMTHTPFTVADGTTRHALRFGDMKINLHQCGAEFEPKAAHVQTGSADLCFLTATPLAQWQEHLAKHGTKVENGPVARTGATGPILSVYLRDLDGNLIEISTQT
ncbi:VOC family protein [uncultured Sulfitobacter sp.]|uniref:VOC family protein n=1 Tax=uncultured Sulfitobacter sp. TaxID=191468 RepID=UPI00262A9992|nr:VOC family protein [uncultured Sulfitobacter sp.]